MDGKYKFIEEERDLCAEDIPEIEEWLKFNDINKAIIFIDSSGKERKLTLIELAANNGCVPVVEFLIKKGADLFLNAEGYWDSLLEFSAADGQIDVIKCLIENGFDREVFLRDNSLIAAAFNNYPDVVKFLVEQGKNINQSLIRQGSICEGDTALKMAAQENSVECVKLLCELGADINVQSEYDTPLYSAAAEGNLEVVKILIEYGADVNYKNEFGTTPLKIAKKYKRKEVAKYLAEHGAKIN